MKLSFIVLFMLCIQSFLFSQTKERVHFTSINQLGFVNSSANTDNSYKLETINGIKYKKWSAGAGIGVDWQAVRSVPLFVDVRKYFTSGKNNWFIYGDAGINIWWDNNSKNDNYYSKNSPYLNTVFAEAGIGYLLQLEAKTKLLLSIGYGNKETKYKTSYLIINEFPPYISTYDNSYLMSTYLNRLVFKIGIQF